MKQNNIVMYDTLLWNWIRIVIYDDAIFITFFTYEAIGYQTH